MPLEIDLEQSAVFRDLLQRKWDEGWAEGLAKALLCQMERRFGPVPEAAVSRVRMADPALLSTWIERVLDAADLEAVFDPDSRH